MIPAMSFPLEIGDHVVADPAALAALVRDDSGPQSGGVVPGKRPAGWVLDLVEAGRLERRLAIGLAAALIQHPDPITACEGARLARALGEVALGTLLVRALRAHDTALLLRVDPAGAGASVEDTLLRAAVETADLGDATLRKELLERLRHAGLPELEIPTLLEHGDAEDLRTWLPAVLAEGLDDEDEPLLRARLERGDEGAEVIRALTG